MTTTVIAQMAIAVTTNAQQPAETMTIVIVRNHVRTTYVKAFATLILAQIPNIRNAMLPDTNGSVTVLQHLAGQDIHAKQTLNTL